MSISLASRLRRQARELLELAELLEPSSTVSPSDAFKGTKTDALIEALERAGGFQRLADYLGISRQAVMQWSVCPAERVLAVEAASGVPRHLLRPDLYPMERKGVVEFQFSSQADAAMAGARWTGS